MPHLNNTESPWDKARPLCSNLRNNTLFERVSKLQSPAKDVRIYTHKRPNAQTGQSIRHNVVFEATCDDRDLLDAATPGATQLNATVRFWARVSSWSRPKNVKGLY